MDLWIGTSGYSYPDWVGGFYPAGTRPGRMLAFYARQFPLVELNFTFYRPPTLEMLARLAGQAPPGFQFVVKLPRTISHERRTDDLDGFRKAVFELDRRGRLSGLLCQLPQSAHDDRPSRAWVKTVGKALGDLRLAVEFRHRSWAGPETLDWMGELGLTTVAVDVPDLPGLYPRGWVQSGPTAYVRFHSRNKANWYASDQGRYHYRYDDAALTEWLDAASAAAAEGTAQRTQFLFNNCYRRQAVDNARRMGQLAARRAGLSLEPPPGPAVPAQRGLFDDAATRKQGRAGRNRPRPAPHYQGEGISPSLRELD
jgi:uncharacterized protein YecE (DUF72 family)